MRKSPHISIAEFLEQKTSGVYPVHPFWHFEPWDVGVRPDWVLKLAEQDGVDLNNEDFTRHIGRTPHPFQSGFILSTARFRGSIAATQVGKAQSHDAKVQCDDGPKRMGDIKLGDRVFGKDGLPHSVVGIYEQGNRDVYQVRFRDGSITECDIEHLWEIYPHESIGKNRFYRGKKHENKKHFLTRTMTLSELIGKYGMNPSSFGHKKWFIPICDPVRFEEKTHIVPPYSLGVLLGDGNYTHKGTAITCHEESSDLIERIREEIGIRYSKVKKGTKTQTLFVSLRRGSVRSELDRMCLGGKKSEEKFVPSEYKIDSMEHRIDLLRGLMDTDGSIYGKSQCEFYSKSKQLAEDVAWIVESLGGTAQIKEKDSHYVKDGDRVDCGIGYRVKIRLWKINPFFTKRKSVRWYKIDRRERRTIRDISFVGRKPCRCIRVDCDDHLYLTDHFIVTHNSHPVFIEIGIMVSGQKPISLSFDKGVDTGVNRVVSRENIIRWGRFDVRSGKFLDYDVDAERSEDWNCGNIIGAGIYPDSKIALPGSVIWVGTTNRALEELWWPRLTQGASSLIPSDFIDKKVGVDGYVKSEHTVAFHRDIRLPIISYESGFRKFESINTWATFFDEEPPDQQCVTAAVNHTDRFAVVETPYMGITYTKNLMFPNSKSEDHEVFHATSYDSPYLTPEVIAHRRTMMPAWEIVARIWGVHTEPRGKPYYDRAKINSWINRFRMPFQLFKFAPSEMYYGIRKLVPDSEQKSLMDVQINRTIEVAENRQDVWRVYEERREGYAYYLMADSAEGAELPEEAGDVLAAMVMRKPIDQTKEEKPKIVATLRSTLPTQAFARVCSYALRYYWNALLCAEGPTRGSFNALFFAELKDYPYWFKQVSLRDSTRKVREVFGFDTNQATRGAIFEGIRDWLADYDDDEYPEIPDDPLLIELAGCVVVYKQGKPRPDHDRKGSLDTTLCFGQGIYIYKHYADQIKQRTQTEEPFSFIKGWYASLSVDKEKKAVYFGDGVDNGRR